MLWRLVSHSRIIVRHVIMVVGRFYFLLLEGKYPRGLISISELCESFQYGSELMMK